MSGKSALESPLQQKMAVARKLIADAVWKHRPSHVFALFSGGHDSATATGLAAESSVYNAVVHINTGTGIPRTLQYIRETCELKRWLLIEMDPDGKKYRDLVLERGFPGGPQSHKAMYYWLKQRQIRRLVREHKEGRRGRVVLVTGIRRDESQRRMLTDMANHPVEREGAIVWVNPILDWTAGDCGDFMELRGIPRNPVVDLLHRSGECLCGAMAHRDEIRLIELFFPDKAREIHALEREVAAKGLPSRWAARSQQTAYDKALKLCGACQLRMTS